MVEMSQQLQQAVQAREDMSEVWEQLLEGNARLRREKSMLETAISETPTRAGGAPYLERGSNGNGNGSGGGARAATRAEDLVTHRYTAHLYVLALLPSELLVGAQLHRRLT